MNQNNRQQIEAELKQAKKGDFIKCVMKIISGEFVNVDWNKKIMTLKDLSDNNEIKINIDEIISLDGSETDLWIKDPIGDEDFKYNDAVLSTDYHKD